MAAQTGHRPAFSHQPTINEIESAPELIEKSQVALGLFSFDAAVFHLGQNLPGEGNLARSVTRIHLLINQAVKIVHLMVVNFEEEGVLEQFTVETRISAQVERPLAK